MIDNSQKLFEAMFLILQEMWEINQAEDLRIFISDADPFLCRDGNSADPVVFEDFNNLYEQEKNSEPTNYDFIIFYLDNLDKYYGDIKKYFVSIPRNECEQKISSYPV